MNITDTRGNLICAVDTETTGLDPEKHDVIQLAILPLGPDMKPNKNYLPFNMHIRPDHPETVDPKAMSVNKIDLNWIMQHGIDSFQAADLLDEWFDKLNLPINKRILVIGQNYCFDKAFLQQWLGALSYDRLFHYHYRDTMVSALYLNDRAALFGEAPPFGAISLGRLANKLQVENLRAHDALEDCKMSAECYRLMLQIYPCL